MPTSGTPVATGHRTAHPPGLRTAGVLLAVLALLAATVSSRPAAAAARLVPTSASTSGIVLSDYESDLLNGINAQRVAAGLSTLRVTGGGTDVARRWAVSMGRAGALSHNPDLGTAMEQNGSPAWRTLGENVASGGAAAAVVTAWMASSAHRANIMNPAFSYVGIGTSAAGGRFWSATDFADSADGRTPTTGIDGGTEVGRSAPTVPPTAAAPGTSTTRIATLTGSGDLVVKEGGLFSAMTVVANKVTSYGLDGLRIGTVTTDGLARVKAGALNAGWVTLADRTRGIAMANNRIAVLGNDGSVRIKEGGVTAGWTTLWGSGASSVVLDGNRIAVVAGGTVYVKDGSVSAGWVRVADATSDLAISGGRIAVVTGGVVRAKDGSLFAGWVTLAAGGNVELAGNRIGVLDGSTAIVKDGLYSRWTTVADRTVSALQVSPSRIAVVDGGTVRVKEGSVFAPWVDISAGSQVTLSR